MNREEKLARLRAIAGEDCGYRELEACFLRWESAFSEMTNGLTETQQDIAWGFVCALNALDTRLMELACDFFSFD